MAASSEGEVAEDPNAPKFKAVDQAGEARKIAASILQDDQTGNTQKITAQVQDAAQPSGLSVKAALDSAGQIAQGSYDSAEGTLSRQQRALGNTMSEGERRVQQRRLGLGRALSTVDARNREAGAVRDRADTARSSSRGLRDIIEAERAGNHQFLAGQDASKTAAANASEDADKNQKIQAAGSIAAIGLSFIPGGVFLAPLAGAATAAATRN